MPQLQNRNPLNIYYVNKKQSNSRVKPQNNNITIKSNDDSKTKIMAVGNSLVKYLQLEVLSSKKNNVKL